MLISLAQLRRDAFRHSLEIPVGFFADEGPSDTVSRLLGDISVIGNGVKILFGKTLREPLKAIGLIAYAMWIDQKLTLVFLCGAPLSLYVISKLGRKIKRATKKSLVTWAEMLGKLKEALGAIKVIKVYNQQEYEGTSFTVINRRLLKRQFRIAKVDSSTGPLEAKSQIDADSEAKIHKAIEEIMQGRTSFIIAHRFSTVITADVIVVMDDGRIIAQGQHDELIQTCSLYQSLYETQLVKA